MANPFVAEIRIVPFNFAPTGWAFCDGQLLPISQNTALFSLLGTTYGGDGKSTFALPDLQGAVPVHWGQGPGLSDRMLGEAGGAEAVTLLTSEIPVHTHSVRGNAQLGDTVAPNAEAVLARLPKQYQQGTASTQLMSPQALTIAGGSLPHNNMMPYLTLNFCIAMQGVFPPRG
jgi:microcystin-dependent protein